MKRLLYVALLAMIIAVGLTSCSNDDANTNEDTPTVTKMIDLHLHLDGAISISSARQLAKMQGIIWLFKTNLYYSSGFGNQYCLFSFLRLRRINLCDSWKFCRMHRK